MNTTHIRFPSNKVRDIERCIRLDLAALYPEGEIAAMTAMLFEAFLGWDTTQRLLHREETINQSDLLRFHWAVTDLLQHRPIQHIIGYTYFLDCKISVNPSVLIPRPETEEIVVQTIQRLSNTPPHNIIDLCTGSGCIAIALAKAFPQATITAVDLSAEALHTARSNAHHNDVDINFIQNNILSPTLPPQHYDLIISNPPYIPNKEKVLMDRNVTDYEPSIALFTPDTDPLLFYRAIASFAQSSLTPQGLIVMEIHETLSKETQQLIESYHFTTTLLNDFRERPRCIIAQRNRT